MKVSAQTQAQFPAISKSEATNTDRDFIVSVLNDLENQNVISINQQITHRHTSFLCNDTYRQKRSKKHQISAAT